MTRMQRRQLVIVLLCHFTAALVALGMPPFFGLILSDAFAVRGTQWVGWFYVAPTVCAALAAPFWGKAADRWGRRWSLLRAQLGLALGFALAGVAPEVWVFLGALVLQGFLGGTFAASSAYLSTSLKGEDLSRGLNWMQGSARAAMVLAPVLFGALISVFPAQDIYLYLAFLPILAALLLGFATSADRPRPDAVMPGEPTRSTPTLPTEWRRLWAVQFAFNFSMVATFPYFIPWVQHVTGVGALAAGMLYSLPHLIYLIALWTPFGKKVGWGTKTGLAIGFLLMALSYAGQAWSGSLIGLALWRIVMGVGMTLGFFVLHGWIAQLTRTDCAGRTFGALDSIGKWAGVAAGLAAGVLSGPAGLSAPLWMGATVLLVTLPLILTFRKPIPLDAEAPKQVTT
ncbi:MFS transporter [Marinobacter sp. ELB17]|uniref:MFS transporter n=1 Tax=Marinobacter sp. ELB17 TaxID=270374 RepID=UPI0000F39C39|nr:MFS transporter [Marinobacter sp. ELB17]EAZ97699.1 transport protein [Marinobacter sp. ELB17]